MYQADYAAAIAEGLRDRCSVSSSSASSSSSNLSGNAVRARSRAANPIPNRHGDGGGSARRAHAEAAAAAAAAAENEDSSPTPAEKRVQALCRLKERIIGLRAPANEQVAGSEEAGAGGSGSGGGGAGGGGGGVCSGGAGGGGERQMRTGVLDGGEGKGQRGSGRGGGREGAESEEYAEALQLVVALEQLLVAEKEKVEAKSKVQQLETIINEQNLQFKCMHEKVQQLQMQLDAASVALQRAAAENEVEEPDILLSLQGLLSRNLSGRSLVWLQQCEESARKFVDKVQAAASSLRRAVPDGFRCPITQDIMVDPVVVADSGHTYERAAITQVLLVCC